MSAVEQSAETCSVASLTTSFNSADALARQLDALLQQTRPIQEIIVVDNASTDETSTMLAARYPQVTVLHLPENLGTAGALAAGLTYAALEKKHNWIWMFDQDSLPDASALKTMLADAQRWLAEPRQVGMIAALPVGRDRELSSSPWFWRNGFVKPPAELLREPVLFTDMVITSGSMVRGEVVAEVGLPRSDFFIDFVDYEYCLRIRSRGFKIAVLTRAKLYHEIGNAHKVWFLGRQHLWAEHRPFREYYYSRNLTYSIWWLYPSLSAKAFAVRHLAHQAIAVLLFGPQRLRSLNRMLQGLHDGCRARLGVRFRPD